MPTKNEIIEALQFEIIHDSYPVNETGDARYVFDYQFETSAPDDVDGYSGWVTWTNAEQAAVRAAMDLIETFLNVDFNEVSGSSDADISLGLVTLDGSTTGVGGITVWQDLTSPLYTITDYDAYAVYDRTLDLPAEMNLVLHELGHALGLDHTFDGVPLDSNYDNNHYSVMSYTADPYSAGDTDGHGFNDAMMVYDLLALQDIWGAAEYRTGDTTYTGPRNSNVDVIWDSAGNDKFDASARTNDVEIDLREGRFSTFGLYQDVAIAYGTEIEKAFGGSGADKLVGNAAANKIGGNRGNDVIYGRAGKDELYGNGGKDRLYGGNGDDRIDGGWSDDVLSGEGGRDLLWGRKGEDTFRFVEGAAKDIVKDYTDGDDMLKFVGFGTEAEVLAAAYEDNGDVKFDFGDDVLVVRHMTLAALEDDLIIV